MRSVRNQIDIDVMPCDPGTRMQSLPTGARRASFAVIIIP